MVLAAYDKQIYIRDEFNATALLIARYTAGYFNASRLNPDTTFETRTKRSRKTWGSHLGKVMKELLSQPGFNKLIGFLFPETTRVGI